MLVKVAHIGGDEASVPTHCGRIHTETHSLVDALSDCDARYVVNGCSTAHYIHDWFDDDKGPNKHMLDAKGEKLAALFKEASKTIANQRKQMQVLMLENVRASEMLQSRNKRLRDEALTKARAAISTRGKQTRMLTWMFAEQAS